MARLDGAAKPRLTSGGEAAPHIRRQSRASHPAARPQLCSISEADFYHQWPVVHAPDGGIAQDFHSPDLF